MTATLHLYIFLGMTVVYMNVTEAAASAGVTRVTIYRWIAKGLMVSGGVVYLTSVIIGGQQRIEQPALDHFLEVRARDNRPSSDNG